MEVIGDDFHVQESQDEQRESGHADEREHDQDGARESVGREVSRATWLPPGPLKTISGAHPSTDGTPARARPRPRFARPS